MRRAKAETLDDILGRLLRQQGLETPLNEYRLKAAWGDVAGRVVEQYTSSVQIEFAGLACQSDDGEDRFDNSIE